MGVSAFAFQGTNAHTILRRLPAQTSKARLTVGNDVPFDRREIWHIPPVHNLLRRCASLGVGTAVFELAFGQATAAYLWEHKVRWPVLVMPFGVFVAANCDPGFCAGAISSAGSCGGHV